MKLLTPTQTAIVSLGISWRYYEWPLSQFDSPDPGFIDQNRMLWAQPFEAPSNPGELNPALVVPRAAQDGFEVAPTPSEIDLAQFIGWMDCGGD